MAVSASTKASPIFPGLKPNWTKWIDDVARSMSSSCSGKNVEPPTWTADEVAALSSKPSASSRRSTRGAERSRAACAASSAFETRTAYSLLFVLPYAAGVCVFASMSSSS